MKKRTIDNPAQLLLGELLGQLRLHQDVTRKQLSRAIRVTEQQIEKYENGAFVPLATLETIAKTLGSPIQKKFIRRISSLRKLEQETGELPEELLDIYREVIVPDDDPLDE